mmetsp:Transcript_11907/g.17766  ORF Transcript_11907/g.17766 Transcript_11907/m.17766 type:complete len:204 (+) Transcript_11907:19-630(+)
MLFKLFIVALHLIFNASNGFQMSTSKSPSNQSKAFQKIRKLFTSCLVTSIVLINGSNSLAIDGSRTVGEIPASGFIFKDTLKVEAFQDPKVSGVTLYISDFDRPITEKLSRDFFSDPSTVSMTCVENGPIILSENVERGKNGEEVFEEKRSLFFKSVKVRRIVDENGGNVIYVAYSSKMDPKSDDNKSRFKSSLCALPYQLEQ